MFVEQLVREWEALGVDVSVIAPRSIANRIRGGLKELREKNGIAGSPLLYPTYCSFSNKKAWIADFEKITRSRFVNASTRAIERLPLPDLFYGKFLMRGGLAALHVAERYDRPAFADIGENLIELSKYSREEKAAIVHRFRALFTVSEELAEEMERLGAPSKSIRVVPNRIDQKRFYPMDRNQCRQQLSLPEEIPIVLFVGYLTENKGPLRLLKALSLIPETGVKAIFLGRGPQKPAGNHVLKVGPVSPEELPLWLNAADLFVLPTQFEGDCNAIHEAMACGLPVISSSIPAVEAQVPDGYGVLTHPDSPEKLAEAIRSLLNQNEKREKMGRMAAELEKERGRISRAEEILKEITSLM